MVVTVYESVDSATTCTGEIAAMEFTVGMQTVTDGF
jgi:hypothetical protein